MKTPPLMIASLPTLGSFDEPPNREERAAMYRLTKRMAQLARVEPFVLMADGTTLLVSVYQPPPAEVRYKGHDLHDADPKCSHVIADAPGGGIKCTKCRGWFCF